MVVIYVNNRKHENMAFLPIPLLKLNMIISQGCGLVATF